MSISTSKNSGRPSRSRQKGLSRILIVVVLAVLLLIVAFVAYASLRSGPIVDPAKIAKIERGDIARSVVATGRIEPLAKVEVKSKASGIVKKILVDYGDNVTVGQILVELDKEQLVAQVRESKATLLAAEAAAESAEATYERDKVEAEGPDIPFLKSALERARKLHDEGVISISVLDDADKEYQIALNRQAAALRSVAVTRADIARARAQVAQAQAALDQAGQNLAYSTIVSPMDGLVLSRDVEVGDAVSSILVLGSEATLVSTLGDVENVYVLGKVDEADIGKVYISQPARITVESFKEKKFEGEVTKISPLGVSKDNVTTFEVRVSIRNPGGELKANMSANAEIILEEKKGVLLAPETAIVYDKDRNAFIEVPDAKEDSGVRRIAVKLGIGNGIKTEVVDGPAEGQEIVLQ